MAKFKDFLNEEMKVINEKTLSDADIMDMLDTIEGKIADQPAKDRSDSTKEILKICKEYRKLAAKGKLAPGNVGWLMKTMSAFSGG